MVTVDITETWGKLIELNRQLNTDKAILLKDLDINKKLLARQCDLAREAETELEALRGKVRQLLPYFPHADTYHITMPDHVAWAIIADLRAAVVLGVKD